MQDFINALKEAWEWFVNTGLPKDSANTIVAMIENNIIPLIKEYIQVLFG